MAELTLSRKNLLGGPDIEKTYEFDPENKETVKEIFALLPLRKNGDQTIERLIASYCAESMEKKQSPNKKSTFFSQIKRYYLNSFLSTKKENRTTTQSGKNIVNAFPRTA
jgi:hypothetical protein